MGFYGNITNTSKTQFQFDRIYPNRKTMDENAGTDGIYMGRYVLVEYDINDEKYLDNYPRLFKYDNRYYYTADMQDNPDSRIEVKYGEKNVEKGQFFRVTEKLDFDPSNGVDNSIYVLYKCTGLKENNIATFEPVSDADEIHNNYVRNYNTDTKEYGPGRGWDSTVWQKVFVGGDTKYVLIAELNSVVPTFGITVDAPTMNPIVPHFDQESNNIYYKLHLQPSWGMRVKSAEGIESDKQTVPSDEKVVWKKEIYNTATDEETIKYFDGKNWVDAANGKYPTHDGAIYYNKAGFSKDNIVYSPAGIEDRVTIEPTGISKTSYNVHNGSAAPQTKEAPDIQEISIILPSIGDSIAEMWDLVYGSSSQNNGTKRNTDVEWDSTDGLRMVNVTEDGNGWTYDPDKVETLAGGINAIHDLMGMIIVDKNDLSTTNIDELNLDGIYYDKATGTYNRKIKDYEYTVIENKNIDPYEGKKVTLTEDTYKPNIYYLNEDLTKKDDGAVFDNTKTYYEKYLNAQPMGTAVTGLIDWTPEMYYYKNISGNIYTLDKSESPDDDKVYYSVIKEEVDLPVTYEKGKYWYKQKRDSVDGEYYDYFRENLDTPQSDKNIKYYTPIFTEVKDNLLPYRENTYATLVTVPNSKPEVKIYVIDKDGFNADAEYYALSSYTIVTEEIDIVIKGEDGTEMPGKQTIEKIKYDKEPEKIKLFDPLEKKYYYKLNEDAYKIFDSYNDLPANTTKFYTVEEGLPIEDFYISETYYYQKYPGVFVLDEEKVKVNGRIYYKIEDDKTVLNFYRPDTYYYERELDGEYVLDTNEKMTPNRYYYLGEEFYVYEDTLEVFDKYSLWNNNVKTVPHTVTLARREAKWSYKELVGFARSMNTIHGLILEINKIMEFENEMTRDLNTVQGCINKLKDIIFKFDQLIPGTFVIVDAYGRVHSADYTTKQSYKAINKNTGNIISTVGETEDRWIDLDINDNAKESIIYIRHNYTSTENSDSVIDKNGEEETDTIRTYYPIIDNTGHIVGDHYETITLPYGFKTIKVVNTTDDIVSAPTSTINVNGQVADNTQDTLIFNASNRWIKLDNDTKNTVKIGHNLSDFEAGSANIKYGLAKDTSAEELDGDNTFEVPYFGFDEAGHINFAETHTVKLPEGFGNVTVANEGEDSVAFVTAQNATIEADSMADTVAIDTGNRWITIVGDSVNDKITIYHNTPNPNSQSSNTTKTGDEAPNFGATFEIPEVKYDEAGHIFNVDTHTVTIPQLSLNQLTTTNASVITALSLDATTGFFNQSSKNVGELILTGYDKPANGLIESTDNINGAFKKLQEQIIGEISDREAAITQEVSDRNNAISAIAGGSAETIASLLQKINTLQDSYDALLESYNTLSTKIQVLEAYHKEENI